MQNPHVRMARAFLKEDEGDLFVIAYIEWIHTEIHIRENPRILHDKSLNIKVLSLAGFSNEEETDRRILYHAESSEQAEKILEAYVGGRGYTIDEKPVLFDGVFGKLPSDLEMIAEETISRYRKNRMIPRV